MDNNKYLQNTHFYISRDFINTIQERSKSATKIWFGPNFSFDLIEQPLHCEIVSFEGQLSVKLYIRNEMGIYTDPDLVCDFFSNLRPDEERVKLVTNKGTIGNPAETIILFLDTGMALSQYCTEHELVNELSNIELASEGFLVQALNSVPTFQKVSGMQRPAMACTVMFGGVQMRRPYRDEIMGHWMSEDLPFEEQLELAEDGDEDAMEAVALAYLNGDGVDQDAEKAVFWFTRLAEEDSSDAQFNLGLHFAKGFGVERDFEKAEYWMQQAAENGDDDAPDLVDRYHKAVEVAKKAAAGDAQAQADLAEILMLQSGNLEQAGPEDDYALAVELARKSAAQNNGDGLWQLALAYAHGRGVEEDKAKAVELFRKGAELGNAKCQQNLAVYYLQGEVVEENQKYGFELAMKSAQQGNGLGMRTVGQCYQFGNGVEDDMTRAIYWYEKALKVIDDPELAQKVHMFKNLESLENEKTEDNLEATFPTGYMEAMEKLMHGKDPNC